MSKQDLRIVKTKKLLQEALLTLLKTKPLAQIKVTELCKIANINRGTFYLHFEEVGDLFKEFYQEMMEDLHQSYEAPYKLTPTISVATLNPKYIRIFHHVKKYESFYRIVFSENTPLIYYYMLLEQISLNLTKSYEFHEKKTMQPFAIAYQSNAIVGLVIEWYKNDFQQSVEQMNEYLVATLNAPHS